MNDIIPAKLWLRNRYGRVDGKPCRDYEVFNDDATPILGARAFRVPGRMIIHAHGAIDRPVLLARPRLSFPFTGKYDAFAAEGGPRIGILSRNGRFRDGRGRLLGRFRDARSWKEHLTEGVGTAVLEILITGESGVSDGPDARGFVLFLGNRPAGALARRRMPFHTEPEAAQRQSRLAPIRRFLPRKLGDRLFARRPASGWRLELDDSGGETDRRIVLAAAILAIEIALW